MKEPIIIDKLNGGSVVLTQEEADYLFTAEQQQEDEIHFEQLDSWRLSGICESCVWDQIDGTTIKAKDTMYIWKKRTMFNAKPCGFALDGYVSVKGKKRTCFTTSILFELPNGHLLDVGAIYARIPDKELKAL